MSAESGQIALLLDGVPALALLGQRGPRYGHSRGHRREDRRRFDDSIDLGLHFQRELQRVVDDGVDANLRPFCSLPPLRRLLKLMWHGPRCLTPHCSHPIACCSLSRVLCSPVGRGAQTELLRARERLLHPLSQRVHLVYVLHRYVRSLFRALVACVLICRAIRSPHVRRAWSQHAMHSR